MYKDLLPIGSIVTVRGSNKSIMICGRIVTCEGSDKVMDYLGCYHPEGIVDAEGLLFFNRTAIESCLYRGYEDEQEKAFHENVLDHIVNAEVENGELVMTYDADGMDI